MNNVDVANKYHDTATHLDTRGNPMLLGIHPAEDLERAPYGDWFNKNYADYTVDSAAAGALRPLLKGKTFELYMGTWCGDSKREIPRMLKILRYAGVRPSQIRLVMVDSHDSAYKQSPAHEEKGKDIHRVPDLLVYDHQQEMNRIVEEPVVSLEKDLLRIVQQDGYQPSYPGASWLSHRLKAQPVATADKEKLAAELKPVAHSQADLVSLAWLWMHSGAAEKEKAMLALQINTLLYPNAAVSYDLMADLQVQRGHTEEARVLYRKVLELQPENAKTKEKLAKLQ